MAQFHWLCAAFGLTGLAPSVDNTQIVYTMEEVNSLTEALRIYISLRNDIISCDLQPGASVSEAQLCSRYKASRNRIPEACRRLREAGLLQLLPFRGFCISPLRFVV